MDEKKLQWMCDWIEINDLKNRYARMCNDNHNENLIPEIFAPDCAWVGSPDDPWGAASSREDYVKMFISFQSQMDGTCLGHNISNGCIDIDDDGVHAKGHWHLFGAYLTLGGPMFLEQGWYDDDYVKLNTETWELDPNGRWFIKTLRFKDNLVWNTETTIKGRDDLIQDIPAHPELVAKREHPVVRDLREVFGA